MRNRESLLQLAALCGFLLLIGAAVGLWVGYELYHQAPPPAEDARPAVRQQDGSIVLQRLPDPAAKPAHAIPAGGKAERLVKVTVQPRRKPMPVAAADSTLQAEPDCPPVDVDLSLVRMPDETLRVVASAEGGAVLGGVDVPVVAPGPPAKTLLWAAGLSLTSDREGGVWIDRDVGPWRIGLDLDKSRDDGMRSQLRLGLRF